MIYAFTVHPQGSCFWAEHINAERGSWSCQCQHSGTTSNMVRCVNWQLRGLDLLLFSVWAAISSSWPYYYSNKKLLVTGALLLVAKSLGRSFAGPSVCYTPDTPCMPISMPTLTPVRVCGASRQRSSLRGIGVGFLEFGVTSGVG